MNIKRITRVLCLPTALAAGASAAPVQWTTAVGGNDHWYEIVSVGTPGEGNPSLGKTWSDARRFGSTQ